MIKKEREDRGEGRERARESKREGGGIKQYLHMEIPEKKKTEVRREKVDGWRDGQKRR